MASNPNNSSPEINPQQPPAEPLSHTPADVPLFNHILGAIGLGSVFQDTGTSHKQIITHSSSSGEPNITIDTAQHSTTGNDENRLLSDSELLSLMDNLADNNDHTQASNSTHYNNNETQVPNPLSFRGNQNQLDATANAAVDVDTTTAQGNEKADEIHPCVAILPADPVVVSTRSSRSSTTNSTSSQNGTGMGNDMNGTDGQASFDEWELLSHDTKAISTGNRDDIVGEEADEIAQHEQQCTTQFFQGEDGEGTGQNPLMMSQFYTRSNSSVNHVLHTNSPMSTQQVIDFLNQDSVGLKEGDENAEDDEVSPTNVPFVDDNATILIPTTDAVEDQSGNDQMGSNVEEVEEKSVGVDDDGVLGGDDGIDLDDLFSSIEIVTAADLVEDVEPEKGVVFPTLPDSDEGMGQQEQQRAQTSQQDPHHPLDQSSQDTSTIITLTNAIVPYTVDLNDFETASQVDEIESSAQQSSNIKSELQQQSSEQQCIESEQQSSEEPLEEELRLLEQELQLLENEVIGFPNLPDDDDNHDNHHQQINQEINIDDLLAVDDEDDDVQQDNGADLDVVVNNDSNIQNDSVAVADDETVITSAQEGNMVFDFLDNTIINQPTIIANQPQPLPTTTTIPTPQQQPTITTTTATATNDDDLIDLDDYDIIDAPSSEVAPAAPKRTILPLPPRPQIPTHPSPSQIQKFNPITTSITGIVTQGEAGEIDFNEPSPFEHPLAALTTSILAMNNINDDETETTDEPPQQQQPISEPTPTTEPTTTTPSPAAMSPTLMSEGGDSIPDIDDVEYDLDLDQVSKMLASLEQDHLKIVGGVGVKKEQQPQQPPQQLALQPILNALESPIEDDVGDGVEVDVDTILGDDVNIDNVDKEIDNSVFETHNIDIETNSTESTEPVESIQPTEPTESAQPTTIDEIDAVELTQSATLDDITPILDIHLPMVSLSDIASDIHNNNNNSTTQQQEPHQQQQTIDQLALVSEQKPTSPPNPGFPLDSFLFSPPAGVQMVHHNPIGMGSIVEPIPTQDVDEIEDILNRLENEHQALLSKLPPMATKSCPNQPQSQQPTQQPTQKVIMDDISISVQDQQQQQHQHEAPLSQPPAISEPTLPPPAYTPVDENPEPSNDQEPEETEQQQQQFESGDNDNDDNDQEQSTQQQTTPAFDQVSEFLSTSTLSSILSPTPDHYRASQNKQIVLDKSYAMIFETVQTDDAFELNLLLETIDQLTINSIFDHINGNYTLLQTAIVYNAPSCFDLLIENIFVDLFLLSNWTNETALSLALKYNRPQFVTKILNKLIKTGYTTTLQPGSGLQSRSQQIQAKKQQNHHQQQQQHPPQPNQPSQTPQPQPPSPFDRQTIYPIINQKKTQFTAPAINLIQFTPWVINIYGNDLLGDATINADINTFKLLFSYLDTLSTDNNLLSIVPNGKVNPPPKHYPFPVNLQWKNRSMNDFVSQLLLNTKISDFEPKHYISKSFNSVHSAPSNRKAVIQRHIEDNNNQIQKTLAVLTFVLDQITPQARFEMFSQLYPRFYQQPHHNQEEDGSAAAVSGENQIANRDIVTFTLPMLLAQSQQFSILFQLIDKFKAVIPAEVWDYVNERGDSLLSILNEELHKAPPSIIAPPTPPAPPHQNPNLQIKAPQNDFLALTSDEYDVIIDSSNKLFVKRIIEYHTIVIQTHRQLEATHAQKHPIPSLPTAQQVKEEIAGLIKFWYRYDLDMNNLVQFSSTPTSTGQLKLVKDHIIDQCFDAYFTTPAPIQPKKHQQQRKPQQQQAIALFASTPIIPNSKPEQMASSTTDSLLNDQLDQSQSVSQRGPSDNNHIQHSTMMQTSSTSSSLAISTAMTTPAAIPQPKSQSQQPNATQSPKNTNDGGIKHSSRAYHAFNPFDDMIASLFPEDDEPSLPAPKKQTPSQQQQPQQRFEVAPAVHNQQNRRHNEATLQQFFTDLIKTFAPTQSQPPPQPRFPSQQQPPQLQQHQQPANLNTAGLKQSAPPTQPTTSTTQPTTSNNAQTQTQPVTIKNTRELVSYLRQQRFSAYSPQKQQQIAKIEAKLSSLEHQINDFQQVCEDLARSVGSIPASMTEFQLNLTRKKVKYQTALQTLYEENPYQQPQQQGRAGNVINPFAPGGAQQQINFRQNLADSSLSNQLILNEIVQELADDHTPDHIATINLTSPVDQPQQQVFLNLPESATPNDEKSLQQQQQQQMPDYNLQDSVDGFHQSDLILADEAEIQNENTPFEQPESFFDLVEMEKPDNNW